MDQDRPTRLSIPRRGGGMRDALAGAAASLIIGVTLLASIGALVAITLFGPGIVLLVALGLAFTGALGGVIGSALTSRGRSRDVELGDATLDPSV